MGRASGNGMSTHTHYPAPESRTVSDLQRLCEEELARLQRAYPRMNATIRDLARPPFRYWPRDLVVAASIMSGLEIASEIPREWGDTVCLLPSEHPVRQARENKPKA